MSSARVRSGANACMGTPPSNWITGIRHASSIERHDLPAVEEADGDHVERVQQECRCTRARGAACESRAEPIAHTTAAALPPAAGPASEMSAFRHGVSPACWIFTYAPMNGMNIGADTFEPLPPRLDDMAELVHEDHQHEAERERPAVEQERVRRDGDEEAEELDEDEAELEGGAADQQREPAEALEQLLRARSAAVGWIGL